MQASINPPVILFWAIVRLILGIAQMAGSVALAICLYRYGAGRETMIALFVTMGATILSILLFRVLRVQGKERR
jgi:predicted lysophospholipase L1 biosynthesis ABC-type transport system permease subunit